MRYSEYIEEQARAVAYDEAQQAEARYREYDDTPWPALPPLPYGPSKWERCGMCYQEREVVGMRRVADGYGRDVYECSACRSRRAKMSALLAAKGLLPPQPRRAEPCHTESSHRAAA